ncbi:MAG: NADAR family protein, partial [Acidobacteria bacterium]|nr:NADAR family protein [Acidobacteriota bacterium]
TEPNDIDMRRKIATVNPYEAKRLGRKVKLRADWENIRLAVMKKGLSLKFSPGTSWHTRLMATGDEEIVEWNNWGDRYWGRDVRDRRGENHLGRLLMELRNLWRKSR